MPLSAALVGSVTPPHVCNVLGLGSDHHRIQRVRQRLENAAEFVLPGRTEYLNFIHIGKCGGRTVNVAIRESPTIQNEFARVWRTHVRRPIYKRNTRYLFVVRNPIDRAVSAFNWRQRMVSENGSQRRRFAGELEALSNYESIENLAVELYDGAGRLRDPVARNFRSVHHLREGMSFYLEPLLPRMDASQVFGVLCQETLDEDIETLLGCRSTIRANDNRSNRVALSQTARSNLGRFLSKDFECVARLCALAELPSAKSDPLLAR